VTSPGEKDIAGGKFAKRIKMHSSPSARALEIKEGDEMASYESTEWLFVGW
jgi:hypothetical protein